MHSDLKYIKIPGGRLSEPGGKEPRSNHGPLCIIHSSCSIRLDIKSCPRAFCPSHVSKRANASSYLMSPLQKVRRRAYQSGFYGQWDMCMYTSGLICFEELAHLTVGLTGYIWTPQGKPAGWKPSERGWSCSPVHRRMPSSSGKP